MLFERFAKVEPILKGFSCDMKYCVTAYDGTKYLLRITPADKSETRKDLFEMLKRVAALGVPMCKPLEFGDCPDGVYILYSWIDGEDLDAALPKLSESEQYKLGEKAGEVLRVIHTIPAPENQEDWAAIYNSKTDIKIKEYQGIEEIQFDGGEYFIKYIEQNRELLENRPQCFIHGDYHAYNMMLENGKLIIIDFGNFSYRDPWEEFFKIIFCAQVSPHFATGRIHGYFDGEPPPEFFKLLAFYTSNRTLLAIKWAMQFGQSQVDITRKIIENILKWHDNMNNLVPSWYLKNYKLKYKKGLKT